MATVLAAMLLFLGAAAQDAPGDLPLERTISGQTLVSKNTPAVWLEFDRAFLHAGGQRFILDEVLMVRLVHLADAHKRHELMIIYLEDLAPTGFTVEALAEGGGSAAQFPRLSDELLKRASGGLRIRRAEAAAAGGKAAR